MDAPFRSFTVGFAKWRYETTGEIVCQLARLASFVQQGFLGALQNTKPEGSDEACKDAELWVFIEEVPPFMQKADRLRLWSCGWSCHETVVVWTESCVREEGHALSGAVGQNICFL